MEAYLAMAKIGVSDNELRGDFDDPRAMCMVGVSQQCYVRTADMFLPEAPEEAALDLSPCCVSEDSWKLQRPRIP